MLNGRGCLSLDRIGRLSVLGEAYLFSSETGNLK